IAAARAGADDPLHARLDDVEAAVDALLGERDLHGAVRAALTARLPVFFHFDDYSLLPGRVDLDALEGDGASAALRTARALLRLAGADAAKLASDDYEDRRAELEAV